MWSLKGNLWLWIRIALFSSWNRCARRAWKSCVYKVAGWKPCQAREHSNFLSQNSNFGPLWAGPHLSVWVLLSCSKDRLSCSWLGRRRLVPAACPGPTAGAGDGLTFWGSGRGKGPGREVRRAWGRCGDSAGLALDQRSNGRVWNQERETMLKGGACPRGLLHVIIYARPRGWTHPPSYLPHDSLRQSALTETTHPGQAPQ